MGKLASQLENYYQKVGNKIIFYKRFTLNRLALEMWQELGYRGIDVSSLSRVINGKRLFTIEQLEVFCRILKIKKQERNKLFLTLEADYLSRYGLKLTPRVSSSSDVIDLLTSHIGHLYDIREHGLMQTVMDWADELIDQTRRYLYREQNGVYKNKLLSLLGNILFEKGYASGSALLPVENMSIVLPLARQQLTLAKQTNSPDLAAKAYVLQAFALYALGRYSFSKYYRKFYEKSFDVTKKALTAGAKSDLIDLICWRYIALNSTYLSDALLFQQAEKEIRRIVERHKNDYNLSYITWALDSVARGQSYFGDSRALNTVLESKSYERKIGWRDPLRESATIRNELEVLKNLKILDNSYIQQKVERGLLLSSECGFYRYKKYFENYLA